MQDIAHNNAGPLKKLDYILSAVKFEQSLFALPFAFIGMLLAADGLPELEPFLWVTLAMVGARNAGMAVNRVFDRNVDALNPRTADRHLPRGLLRPWELSALAAVGLALYFVAAWQLNPLAFALSPVGALFVVGYSTVKRFSWLTHFTLGMTLAIAPAGGWVAVTGSLSWETVLLYAVVMTFASGFDIFNTVGDIDFDRAHGINALPARFGVPAAFWVSRTMHTSHRRLPAGAGAVARAGMAVLRGMGHRRRPAGVRAHRPQAPRHVQAALRLLAGQRRHQPRHPGLHLHRRGRGVMTHERGPIVVGVTGASGSVLANRLVDALLRRETDVALVCSSGGRLVWAEEMDRSYAATVAGWEESPYFTEYAIGDLRAPIASGSYPTRGMAVVPCSMNSLSAIAHGRADNLLLRAADVCLKERRTLVVTPRETPLHSGHLENMLRVSQLGAVVLPPEPPFYLRPQTVDEVVDFVVDRVLVALGVEDTLQDEHRYHPKSEREA